MASRSRTATPDLVIRPHDRRRDASSPLHCCCGSEECVLLRRNCSILESVEKDVHTAAQLGQVRPGSLFFFPAKPYNHFSSFPSFPFFSFPKYTRAVQMVALVWKLWWCIWLYFAGRRTLAPTLEHSEGCVPLSLLRFDLYKQKTTRMTTYTTLLQTMVSPFHLVFSSMLH